MIAVLTGVGRGSRIKHSMSANGFPYSPSVTIAIKAIVVSATTVLIDAQ